MKKHKILILLFCLLSIVSFHTQAQENVIIELPETYELSNIILSLTKYGQSDKYEVMKGTKYYDDVLAYFEPVKNHPLLDSVDYSREKWDYYLSFRTDAYAFAFDENNRLKRVIDFYSMSTSITPFDNHLGLINDFVEKSGFRKFFASKKDFYNHMIQNYKQYYYVNESMEFLNTKIGRPQQYNNSTTLATVLSPLVGRMNCHRDVDSLTSADFISASADFINGVAADNIIPRVVDNHMLFTEMDHGYVNPISDKYESLITENFNNAIWDKGSGYPGSACFNEYMTWAVYDLFVQDRFPELADSVALQWQYQNASRGFFAQNLFAQKVIELYNDSDGNGLEKIYEPLLKWCKEVEKNITLPILTNVGKGFVETDVNNVQISFSESMNTKEPFGVKVAECNSNKLTGKNKVVEISNARWSDDGKTLHLSIDTEYNEFALFFNWWGIRKPLLSKNGILLKAQSRVLLKKQQIHI